MLPFRDHYKLEKERRTVRWLILQVSWGRAAMVHTNFGLLTSPRFSHPSSTDGSTIALWTMSKGYIQIHIRIILDINIQLNTWTRFWRWRGELPELQRKVVLRAVMMSSLKNPSSERVCTRVRITWECLALNYSSKIINFVKNNKNYELFRSLFILKWVHYHPISSHFLE